MKQSAKLHCRLLAAGAALLSLAGCSLLPSASWALPPAGGWVEQEVLAVDIQAQSVSESSNIFQQDNGELWMTLSVYGPLQTMVFHSSNDGQNWELASGWADPITVPDGVRPREYAVTPDGTPWMLGFRETQDNGDGEYLLYCWDAGSWQLRWQDGSGSPVWGLCTLDDNRVMLHMVEGNGHDALYVTVSREGQTVHSVALHSDSRRFANGKHTVEWYVEDGVWYLDETEVTRPMGGTPLLLKDDTLYVWKDSGVQVRGVEGTVWEELLPPEESPGLQLPDVKPMRLAETNSGTLLVMAQDSGSGTLRLLRYSWEPSLSRSGEVVRVYSLYDNYAVRYAVAEYLRTHPGAQVSYQPEFTAQAQPEEVQAAAERLAQRLENGTGPDLVVLDGMLEYLPLDQLCAEGMLCDLTEAVQDKDLIPAARMGQTGPLYAVACRVQVPALWMPRDMQPPADLSAFADAVQAGPHIPSMEFAALLEQAENGQAPVWTQNPLQSSALLYLASRPSLVKNGKLDLAAMEEFLQTLQRLVVLEDPQRVWVDDDWQFWSGWLRGEKMPDTITLQCSRTALATGSIESAKDIFYETEEPLSPVPVPAMGEQAVYLPQQILAAPLSGNTDAAKQIVSLMLQTQIQQKSHLGNWEQGMPTDRQAQKIVCGDILKSLKEVYGSREDTGELEAMCAMMEKADTPVLALQPFDEPAVHAAARVLQGYPADEVLKELALELAELS